MRTGMIAAIVLVLPHCLFAQTNNRLVLWDFEAGIEGWWANPWGGGEAAVEPGDGKFSAGLACTWEDIPRGGNIVSPFLEEHADWRGEEWSIIGFWLKGDGTPTTATLQVLCKGPGEKELGYSRAVALDSTEWRRFSLDLRTFWNREKIPFDSSKIGRLILSCTGTHQAAVDQIALEKRQRPVPLKTVGGPAGPSPSAELFAFDDAWLLRLDLTTLRPRTVSAEIAWPGGETTQAQVDVADPPEDEPLLWLEPPDRQPGQGTLKLSANVGGASFEFPVAYSLPPLEPQLGLLPTPKQIERAADNAGLAVSGRLVVHAAGPPDLVGPVQEYLAAELSRAYGIDAEVRPPREQAAPLIIGVTPLGREFAAAPAPRDDLDRRGPEAYFLHVAESGATIAATARPGLRYGAMTLLQLTDHARVAGEGRMPAVEITDWPSLPIRGITIPLPTNRWGHPNDPPVDPAFFEDFVLRTCVAHKLNTIVFLVHQAMHYERHPEIDGPAAWPQETVRALVDKLKVHDINVIPLLNSLGHANWMVIPIERLREDGDTHTLCTRHPDGRPILLDCYQEVINVFEPTHFHMGLDEIRWQTFSKPEEERCSICAGVDKREIFVEHVRALHDFLTKRNIRPLMWGDMVLRKHNGGPSFYLADTLTDLPRDIMIANWSLTLDQLSNHDFRQLGFPVIQSNSRGVTPAQQQWLEGNFFGIWSKTPWLTEGPANTSTAYSYLSVLIGAEYAWNLYPDALVAGVPLSADFFRARLGALTRLGLSGPPVPHGPVLLTGDLPEPTPCQAGRAAFGLWEQALSPAADQPADVPVGQAASSLLFLVAADVPDDQADEFAKEFHKKESWHGAPIGEFLIRFADGTEIPRPLLYGFEVRDSIDGKLPYAYGAIDYWTDPDGRAWYAVQWSNPTPDKPIEKVIFTRGATLAQPLLRAISLCQPHL